MVETLIKMSPCKRLGAPKHMVITLLLLAPAVMAATASEHLAAPITAHTAMTQDAIPAQDQAMLPKVSVHSSNTDSGKYAAVSKAQLAKAEEARRPEERMLLVELTTPAPTPWGPAGAVILCLLPIIFLVLVTVVKQLLLPTSISLPVAAAMLAFIRLAYLSSPTVLVAACVGAGLLEALTPLSIITGAIMLFQTMQHTQCLPWMMAQIKSVSAGHPVGEVFLIGFAFAYLVEGASGFGTPVALAAPMLASLGHAPIPTVVCLLIMNTLATQFGAVGTPIWFGFGDLGLGEPNLQLVGLKASIIVGACAFVIAPLAASFLVPMRELLRSGVFVALSVATAVAPALLISLFSYEFPTLIGGIASVALTGLLVQFKIGLRPIDAAAMTAKRQAANDLEGSAASKSFRKQSARSLKSRSLKGGAEIYRLPNAAGASFVSESYSFVDDVGVVAHPPAASLDFPLTNAPTEYRQARMKSFAAQVDEETIAAQLQQLTNPDAAQPELNGGGRDVPSGNDSVKDCEVGLPPTRSSPSVRMAHMPNTQPPVKPTLTMKDLVLRTLPLWMTVLVLLLTRIPAIPIKRILQSTRPAFFWDLGNFGRFGISASLVIQLRQVLSEPLVNWKYELLYVPFLLPFALASLITVAVHRRDMQVHWTLPFKEAFQRVAGITVATLGALVLVQLIRVGGSSSPAYIIGYYASAWLAQGFLAISAFLGALGSFFSGSTTVSNLTFGDIQSIAAQTINAPVTSMLAVQVAGATIGNMICINNILSAKAVMNMNSVSEGEFIRRTAPVALLFAVMAQGIGLIFTLGGALPDKPMNIA